MAASSRLMIGEAERRYPVRIKIAVPVGGFSERLNRMNEWLDQNAGADRWAITPAGFRGVVNVAIAVYFADFSIAGAFVARWCRVGKVETINGLFLIRDAEPTKRSVAKDHRSPL